jgi:hypothetical protein
MTATTKVPLGPATLNAKWYLDVNTGTHGAPVWVGVFGVTDFKDGLDSVKKDDTDLDSSGWGSQTVTKLDWMLELKLVRKVMAVAPTTYDPGQEVLRGAADGLGITNRVEVRWYEMPDDGPRVEAYQGYAAVEWKPDGGSNEELSTVSVTLSGQGARSPITHPDDAAAVPVVTGLSPAGGAAAGGDLVRIAGGGFTLAGVADVSAVKFGATSAATIVVENDNVLYVVAPAHAGGSVEVKVTNSEGESSTHADFLYA